jgi:hypothetical protein
MPLNVCPALADFHAKNSQESHVARQLRLPLMVREIGPAGAPLRNVAVVEELRVFLVCRSHTPAKLVAKVTGARPTRIHNEDEGRVQLTGNVIVCRFRDLNEEDAEEFIAKLRAVRA